MAVKRYFYRFRHTLLARIEIRKISIEILIARLVDKAHFIVLDKVIILGRRKADPRQCGDAFL